MGARSASAVRAGCRHEASYKDHTGRPHAALMVLVMLLLLQIQTDAATCITTETICKPRPNPAAKHVPAKLKTPTVASAAVGNSQQRTELSSVTRQLLQNPAASAAALAKDEPADNVYDESSVLEAYEARCSIHDLLMNSPNLPQKASSSIMVQQQQQQQLSDGYKHLQDMSSSDYSIVYPAIQTTTAANEASKHRLLLSLQQGRSAGTDNSSTPAAAQQRSAHTTQQTVLSTVRGKVRHSPDGVVFVSSTKITVGVDPQHGGALVYLSSSELPQALANMNLINIWDSGRLIQQSYYGCYDGTCWLHKPWRWNPVQGGSWQNLLPRVDDLDVDDSSGVIRVAVTPRNWGGQELMRDVQMKTHVSLWQHGVKVRFSMRYTGNASHPVYHQEVPAVYLHRKLGVLASYTDSKPWSGGNLTFMQPGEKGQYYRPTERWAAYLDPKSGYGVGVYSPIATQLVAYRVGPDGSGARHHCSYFAPIATEKVKPGREFSYNVFIAVGQVDDLRKWFRQVKDALKHQKIEVQRRLAAVDRESSSTRRS